jgi:hypothetical protein
MAELSCREGEKFAYDHMQVQKGLRPPLSKTLCRGEVSRYKGGAYALGLINEPFDTVV